MYYNLLSINNKFCVTLSLQKNNNHYILFFNINLVAKLTVIEDLRSYFVLKKFKKG
jgi:hypothetical protein